MPAADGRVIVVADGDVDVGLLSALLEPRDGESNRPLVIAADGGATKALAAGVRPDVVIGDGDSLPVPQRRRLLDREIEVRLFEADKDESDTELCLLAARDSGARRISLVGALGGLRPEHTAANLLLLADPRFDDIEVEILALAARLVRIGTLEGPGDLRIEGEVGDYVSLLPLGAAVDGVTTHGLRFSLHDATLELGPSRGLSNELTGSFGRVTTRRGCLLVVHTARRRSPLDPRGERRWLQR